jgi:S-adenosylmethionine:tRNA ribosyltransferase-isomerase
MYSEYYRMESRDFAQVESAKDSGNKIICVGTTSVRVLETLACLSTTYDLQPRIYEGYTNLFIYPDYKFKIVDILLTNFHLPKTTLLMLVSAFAGRDNIMHAYAEAMQEKYRFYSYGDAMLIV